MDDSDFENFWFTLKANFLGFYKLSHEKDKINNWSDNLNKLKEEKRYMEIQLYILDYLLLVGKDLFERENVYYTNIFESNIKRWEKIIKKVNFLNKLDFQYYLSKMDKLKLEVKVYLKLVKDNKYELFKKLYFEFNVKDIFLYLLETEQINIYELLENYYGLDDYLFENYNIDIYDIDFKYLKPLKKIKIIKSKM
jgi:hypothetical protein